MLGLVISPRVRGRVKVCKWILSHIDKIQRIWKWVLSQIDKIKEFEHICKLVSYSINCQLVLGWNLNCACMHYSFEYDPVNWYKIYHAIRAGYLILICRRREFEHVYEFVNYSIHYKLILGWNLIWAWMHDSFEYDPINWYKNLSNG